MIVRSLEHASYEGPGSIASWVERRGGRLERTRLWAGDAFRDSEKPDLLVIMGGPMSVNDVLVYPWLVSEMELIRSVMDRGGGVLGICLGAQLVVRALGGRVRPAPHREIGWHRVRRAQGAQNVPALPEELPLFHWHGETFDLPASARLLASTEACANQVFSLGRRVLGFQCHPEITPEAARDLVRSCPGDLSPGKWVQTATQILGAPAAWYSESNALCDAMLDYLVEESNEALDSDRTRVRRGNSHPNRRA